MPVGTGWPDPTNPGTIPDYSYDTYHWVRADGRIEVWLWTSYLDEEYCRYVPCWRDFSGATISINDAKEADYIGPILPPERAK